MYGVSRSLDIDPVTIVTIPERAERETEYRDIFLLRDTVFGVQQARYANEWCGDLPWRSQTQFLMQEYPGGVGKRMYTAQNHPRYRLRSV